MLRGDAVGTFAQVVTVVDQVERLEVTRPDADTACVHALVGEAEAFARWTITGTDGPVTRVGSNCVTLPQIGGAVATAGTMSVTVARDAQP